MLWDAASALGASPLSLKEGGVTSVAFSPDGKTVAAGYVAVGNRGLGGVVLWDAVRHTRLAVDPLPVKEGGVWSIAFSPNDKTIAAGYSFGSSGGVVLWDASARKRLVEDPLAIRDGIVTSVPFAPTAKPSRQVMVSPARATAEWCCSTQLGTRDWQEIHSA